MRSLFLAALLTGAALAHAQGNTQGNAKKELVGKLVQSQQAGVESLARGIVERPAVQMMQAAGQVLAQMPPERRGPVGKAVEAEVRKFVDESAPLLRERALKLAPTIYGAALEEKFSEDELRQLLAWFESPVNKKYQQALPDLQDSFMQKLIAEGSPLLDPKLQALQEKVRVLLGVPAPGAPGAAASAVRPPRAAAPAARPASK
jgi:hypothetical protein